jgi:hypothetical protein
MELAQLALAGTGGGCVRIESVIAACECSHERMMCGVVDMFSWLALPSSHVAVFDATNTTRARRRLIAQECASHDVSVVFVESICEDQSTTGAQRSSFLFGIHSVLVDSFVR